MKNWKPLPGTAALLFAAATLAAILICPSAVFACGDPPPPPPDPEDHWKAGNPITIEITSPDNNEYVPVLSVVPLSALAADFDLYGSGSNWHRYADQVNSGEKRHDHHKWWSRVGDGNVTDQYGEGEYQAPIYKYGATSDVRTVEITAHADDFDRGDDAVQYDDPAVSTSRTIKIWQVTISTRQAGKMDKTTWYDGPPLLAVAGGPKLNWITHGNPAGATRFCMSTEIFGQIPAEVPLEHTVPPKASFIWIQEKKGKKSKKVGATWSNQYHEEAYKGDIDGTYPYVDFDPRSPNSQQGTDHDKVFCWDAPSWQTGPQNNAKIEPPFNWREYKFDMYYKIILKYNGNRISNMLYWDVFFHLKAKPGPDGKYDKNAKWEEITHER